MEILGIGPLELIVILIIALAVFGPDKLPEIGAKLGHSLRDMRRATREFSREIEQAREALEEVRTPLAEAVEPFAEAAQAVGDVSQALHDPTALIRQSVMKELRLEEPTGASSAPAASPAAEPVVPPSEAPGEQQEAPIPVADALLPEAPIIEPPTSPPDDSASIGAEPVEAASSSQD